ncbi:MAG: DUF4432 family protein [bacterium]|nr:DUF4432 family protein [bacterium]
MWIGGFFIKSEEKSMPKLYGVSWNRRQLEKYAGASWQTGGVRKLRFAEGPEDGVEVLQFDNGAGLRFDVMPSRALDIAGASFCGAPLCYNTPSGESHPAHFDSHGLGWLETFPAGLVTTCGLTYAGAPCDDAGALGLHGRIAHQQAREIKYGVEWTGNRKRLFAEGVMKESVLFGPNLTMTRRITAEAGEPVIQIVDRVRNDGFERQPLMMVYHINLGFPVLSEQSEVWINSSVRARDPHSEEHIDGWNRFESPVPNVPEQLFYHDVKRDSKGYAHAALVNPAFNQKQGLGVLIRYHGGNLPRFAQWKNIRAGAYVCGLEPCNCGVEGRAVERERGTLQYLRPGEEKEFIVNFHVLPDNAAIEQARKLIFGSKQGSRAAKSKARRNMP